MNIEIRTDKNIHGSERLISYIRAELTQEFQRYSERITHFGHLPSTIIFFETLY
jgi:hypothetical protein